ncbi:NB-ARC domain-containing protein [Anaerolineales bacterium HSG25]|nr:NB-ARC domain-containing protein [Anaerolineales bacterium HSG25]
MLEINVLDLIPKPIRKKAMDVTVDFVVNTGKNYLGGEIISRIKKLRSDGEFQNGFEAALQRAGERFVREYIDQDEDLATALADDVTFFEDEQVQQALLKILRNPGVYQADEQTLVNQSFDGILPRRRNRERVNRAVNFFLQCLQEEVWNLPELRPIYELQFQRVTAEAVQEQVALQHAQLQATVNMSEDIRGALLQLTEAIAEQKLLPAGEQSSEVLKTSELLPKHNLPQPDYERFIGRKTALKQIRKLLSPEHRSWVVTIDGIGGIGKSALALEVADSYRRHYDNLPKEDRFEAIIWTTAKLSMLTGEGIITRTQSLRTLDDIYTTISVTLEREDITRARTEEQDDLVTNALTQQRTLLIIDNLETVDDERVMAFIRDVPTPTKVMVTTRHRLDIAYPVRLVGMSEDEALELIADETRIKGITLLDEAKSADGSHPMADSHLMTVEQARQLYHRTGGVPLAIVWSVAQMGFGYGVESVLTRLGQPNNDIAKFCFEGAVERIKGRPSHKLLMALSLFATDASRDALGHVADLPDLDRDDGLVELEKLSLVNKVGGRFGLLPLAKVYAKAELSGDGEVESELQKRWVDWFHKFLYAKKKDKYKTLNDVKAELKNILSVMDWCWYTNKTDIFIDFAIQMDFYLWVTGDWNTWYKYIEQGLYASIQAKKELTQVRFLGRLAGMKDFQDELDDGEKLIRRAIRLHKAHKNTSQSAISLWRLASIQIKQKNYKEARKNLQNATKIAEDLGDERHLVRVKRRLAIIDIAEKDYDTAEELLQQVKETRKKQLQEHGRSLSSGLAFTYRLLGYVSFLKKNYGLSNEYLQHSLEMAQTINSPQDIAESKMYLAELKIAQGKINDAKQLCKDAMDVFIKQKMKRQLGETQALLNRIEANPTD